MYSQVGYILVAGMTRGNQRDVDRARAAARKEKAVPKGKKGGSVIERNEQ